MTQPTTVAARLDAAGITSQLDGSSALDGCPALARLDEAGITAYLASYSALDRYYARPSERGFPGVLHVTADATLAELAQVFDELQFGADPLADAMAIHGGTRLCLRCSDSAEGRGYPFTVLDLQFDPRRQMFLDPCDVYHDLRKEALVARATDLGWWQVVAEAAQAISRYHLTVDLNRELIPGPAPEVPVAYQRHLLERILTSRAPAKGLRLLHESGIVASWWPELAVMTQVPHTKDFHPEGDVWEHTLATFAHRKTPDLVLSLGLLLHDVGKPQAVPQGDKRFFAHAEIGARLARRFLRRLEFAPQLIEAVAFLGRNHMLPAALDRVRAEHAEELMSSPLFPHLLELYRADMLSSFASPEPYYHACRLYQRHLRGRSLPQRTVPGGRGQHAQRKRRTRARRFRA